jgi:hypothetical protein
LSWPRSGSCKHSWKERRRRSEAREGGRKGATDGGKEEGGMGPRIYLDVQRLSRSNKLSEIKFKFPKSRGKGFEKCPKSNVVNHPECR